MICNFSSLKYLANFLLTSTKLHVSITQILSISQSLLYHCLIPHSFHLSPIHHIPTDHPQSPYKTIYAYSIHSCPFANQELARTHLHTCQNHNSYFSREICPNEALLLYSFSRNVRGRLYLTIAIYFPLQFSYLFSHVATLYFYQKLVSDYRFPGLTGCSSYCCGQ